MADTDAVRDAAKLLREAEEARLACAPVRDLIGATDLDAAYAVQTLNVELAVAAGRRIAGRKVGLTAKVVQAILESKPHPEAGYRACLGILSLAKTFTAARLEAASQRLCYSESIPTTA